MPTGLQTVRASLANIDQRRGRAGRTAPGVCYRLWDAAETRGFTRAPEPEITRADLSGLVLALAEWGERNPDNLNWFTPPPMGVFGQPSNGCQLGADGGFTLIEKGRAMTGLPIAPALAALIVDIDDLVKKLAARIASLIGEPSLARSADLTERLRHFERDRSIRGNG